MELSLIIDGTVGSTVGKANAPDHPDKASLQEALDEIVASAQKILVEDPAAAAAAAEAEAAAEQKASTSTSSSSSSGEKASK